MNGKPYRDTFAGKSSELYAALEEGDEVKAKRIYSLTSARNYALHNKLSVPKEHTDADGKWTIQADDAEYGNWGKFIKMKGTK